MYLEPIRIIEILKKCTAKAEDKSTLLSWLGLANLLILQTQGQAISAQLIDELKQRFSDIMTAIVAINADPDNQEYSRVLHAQCSEFYRWLDDQKGEPENVLVENWEAWSNAPLSEERCSLDNQNANVVEQTTHQDLTDYEDYPEDPRTIIFDYNDFD